MKNATYPCHVVKFCPRCGSENFPTLDKGRSFKCEECHFNYYINSSAAVACLIFDESGKLLLTQRAIEPAKGMLDLPGGFVEPMETAEEAVKREILEELGLKVVKTTYLVSFPNEYIFSGFSVFTIDLAYLCLVDNMLLINPGDDVNGYLFMDPLKVVKEKLCSESMWNIINYYILNNLNFKK